MSLIRDEIQPRWMDNHSITPAERLMSLHPPSQ